MLPVADYKIRSCIGTYNTSDTYWTNVTVNNSARSWYWIVYVFLIVSMSILTIFPGAMKLGSGRMALPKDSPRS